MYFSIELAKLGPYSIKGLDISRTFVELAGKRAAASGRGDFRQGSASTCPSPTVLSTSCYAARRSRTSANRAHLQEMRHVLKPGGCGLIMFCPDSTSVNQSSSVPETGQGEIMIRKLDTSLLTIAVLFPAGTIVMGARPVNPSCA
ncbi:MAG: class I SAM-dependent methyltransferase [Bryobacteraceae bacterium]